MSKHDEYLTNSYVFVGRPVCKKYNTTNSGSNNSQIWLRISSCSSIKLIFKADWAAFSFTLHFIVYGLKITGYHATFLCWHLLDLTSFYKMINMFIKLDISTRYSELDINNKYYEKHIYYSKSKIREVVEWHETGQIWMWAIYRCLKCL